MDNDAVQRAWLLNRTRVDNLRYTVHLFAALRAGDRHIIDEWAVKLNLSICLLIHLFCIFFTTSV